MKAVKAFLGGSQKIFLGTTKKYENKNKLIFILTQVFTTLGATRVKAS